MNLGSHLQRPISFLKTDLKLVRGWEMNATKLLLEIKFDLKWPYFFNSGAIKQITVKEALYC